MENKKTSDVSNAVILEAVLSLQEQAKAMQDDMRTNYIKRGDIEAMEERLLAEIRPIGRAIDKDAVTIISHERRIHRLERHMV